MKGDEKKSPDSVPGAVKRRVWLERSFGRDGIYHKMSGGEASRPSARADAPASARAALEELAAEVAACTRCSLYEEATQGVLGAGNPQADLIFVGEAPGAEEDRVGEPFVGRAGKLLDKILKAMGLERSDVYITNVIKHRPPGNRTPTKYEIGRCHHFLLAQLEIIRPKVICALGAPAAQTLLNTDRSIGLLRGRFHPYPDDPQIPVMPTYHPAYLLRNARDKGKVWEDMKKIMEKLGRPVPK